MVYTSLVSALLKTSYSTMLWRYFITLAGVLLLAGCASNKYLSSQDHQTWKSSILSYEQALAPDFVNAHFLLSEEIRNDINTRFNGLNKMSTARHLALWLVDKSGHHMKYEVGANLTPIEAYEQRRGNCLSFTFLLVSLAQEFDIKLNFNEVDLPDTWGLNDTKDVVFFRHVNAILKTSGSSQVFDLAMENYDARYPQRFISKRQAVALLHSNLAIEKLEMREHNAAFHHMKIAVAMYPQNADMWINLGVIYKHLKDLESAERAFLEARRHLDKNGLAASNLERLYRQQGKSKLAKNFNKKAQYARQKNPYLHYQQAQQHYKAENYTQARKAIKKAKRLHQDDARFYHLSSQIESRLKNYITALKELEKAYHLSKSKDERADYEQQIRSMVDFVLSLKEKHPQNTFRNGNGWGG